MNFKSTLTPKQLVEAARIIELYRVAHKTNHKEPRYFVGAIKWLEELNCFDRDTISEILSCVHDEVREELAAAERERQEEIEMYVRYEM